MADTLLLYLSAAGDLEAEREMVGRAVASVPVTLGWRVVQSPLRDDPVDFEAVARADVHLVLLGGDARAPVGLEWQAARRAGRRPVLFKKQGVARTPAGDEFARYAGFQAPWRPFGDAADLRRQVLRLLADHLLEQSIYYALAPEELARLQEWRARLDKDAAADDRSGRGAGDSAVILSPERYVPSEGILLEPGKEKGKEP
jgi:hypothetical protein